MAHQWQEQTYYDILEISPKATEGEIRQAYLRAKATYSQDNPALYSVFTKEETRELLALVEEAHRILSNQHSRRNYDTKISLEGSTGDHPADDFLKAAMGASPRGKLSENELGKSFTASIPKNEKRSEGTSPSLTSSEKLAKSKEGTPKDFTSDMVSNLDEGRVGSIRVIHRAQPDIPSGHGRTVFGLYKLDEKMETSILEESQFAGDFFRKVRLYKQIDLDRLCEQTKISKTYLTALENNDYKNLPAPVFTRGFVVQVARLLQVDENKATKGYMELFKKSKS